MDIAMQARTKLNIKKFGIILGILLVAFIILDFNYFYGSLEFYLHKPSSNYQPVKTSGGVNSLAASLKQPNMLYIDSLYITVPVINIDKIGEKYFQAALINGVVHYPGTVTAGQKGNDYIFGHSSDYIWSKGHYKRVFAPVPKIQKGAQIRITDAQGIEYTYTVIDSRKVAANDTSVLSQQNYTRKLLTLQTSYPVGTALARWVVVAELK